MGEHKQCRIILSLLMGLILLAFCLPVCAFAETSELSDGDEKGISLSTTVPPSIISGAGAVYEKCGTDGLMFKTDDAKDNLLRVLIDGNVVSPENYTVSGEPLTVTLHAGYLDTLSVGEHTIEIVTENGSALAGFRVADTNPPASTSTISYKLNGGTLDGKTGTVTVQAENGTVIILPSPTREGYTFDYWEGSRYNAGDRYTVNGDHTFTAQWKKNSTTPGTDDPGKTSPKTGDESNLAWWLSLTIVSMVGTAAAVCARKIMRLRRHGR